MNILERELPQDRPRRATWIRTSLLAQLGSLLFELAWKFGLVLLAWSGLGLFLAASELRARLCA